VGSHFDRSRKPLENYSKMCNWTKETTSRNYWANLYCMLFQRATAQHVRYCQNLKSKQKSCNIIKAKGSYEEQQQIRGQTILRQKG